MGCSLCVIDQGLAFLHFGFGGRADVDLGNTTGEFGQTLLEFFPIVIAIGVVDFAADLNDASFDLVLLASAADDDGLFAGDSDAFCASEVGEFDRFEVDAQVLENRVGVGQGSDISEDGFTAISVAGCFDRSDAQDASHLVDDQSR